MNFQVNQELCTGCGDCVETCPIGALQIFDGKAAINSETCTHCEACLEACPSGAIMQTEIVPAPALAQQEVLLLEAEPLTQSASIYPAPLLGTGLAYLSKEIIPRLADVLFNALEYRLTRPAVQDNSLPPGLRQASMRAGRREGGARRRMRRRGKN